MKKTRSKGINNDIMPVRTHLILIPSVMFGRSWGSWFIFLTVWSATSALWIPYCSLQGERSATSPGNELETFGDQSDKFEAGGQDPSSHLISPHFMADPSCPPESFLVEPLGCNQIINLLSPTEIRPSMTFSDQSELHDSCFCNCEAQSVSESDQSPANCVHSTISFIKFKLLHFLRHIEIFNLETKKEK